MDNVVVETVKPKGSQLLHTHVEGEFALYKPYSDESLQLALLVVSRARFDSCLEP